VVYKRQVQVLEAERQSGRQSRAGRQAEEPPPPGSRRERGESRQ